MKKNENKIHVTFSQDQDYNVRFTFFLLLPHAHQPIELHRVFMPNDEEETLAEAFKKNNPSRLREKLEALSHG